MEGSRVVRDEEGSSRTIVAVEFCCGVAVVDTDGAERGAREEKGLGHSELALRSE